MLENYLYIHKDILPDYFQKVVEAKRLIESGRVREVSQAVKEVGISRSTYYKYKDYILEPTNIEAGRKAVLSMLLNHEQGVLGAVLNHISGAGGNVLTITQSLPIHGKASVTISLDIGELHLPIEALIGELNATAGVESLKLVAVE